MSAPKISIRRSFTQKLNDVPVGVNLPTPDEIVKELLSYTDVILGRVAAPVDKGVMTRMEIAVAYYARASELDMLIHEQERIGNIIRGSDHYRVRTGALRTFREMVEYVIKAGSRDLTHEQLLYAMQRDQEGSPH